MGVHGIRQTAAAAYALRVGLDDSAVWVELVEEDDPDPKNNVAQH